MKIIKNPILPGFNPDPSIIRVGDDYYIATSTFEWFPGVQIHHSRDLVNWRLIAHPLNNISQLDMRGIPNSCGIWAPCLSYDNGIFYLIYTIVRNSSFVFKDTHNYLVTSKDLCKEWSEPIYLSSSGFDPSLFHDDNGKKWIVNMNVGAGKNRKAFDGIVMQEYSKGERKLVGSVKKIFDGSNLRVTEGPHLYKRNGYYYLMTAEGGTGFGHAVTLARSKNIGGPYEIHPENPILTSRYDEKLYLQKAGHASIVETQDGNWYMVHLCSRPIPCMGKSILGRETAIQKMVWSEDGWLRLEKGGNKPFTEVEAPDLPEYSFQKEPERDDFDSSKLDIHFQSLRVPLDNSMMSLTKRPGYLRLIGRESISSLYYQSLVARRQQAFCYTSITCLEFEPENPKQMAGLICYYNTTLFHYIYVTYDDNVGKCMGILTCDNGKFKQISLADVSIKAWVKCYIKVEVDYNRLQFSYSKDGINWNTLGPVLDASILSDEHFKDSAFTGAFIGLCCQDTSGQQKHADFDFFEYVERNI